MKISSFQKMIFSEEDGTALKKPGDVNNFSRIFRFSSKLSFLGIQIMYPHQQVAFT